MPKVKIFSHLSRSCPYYAGAGAGGSNHATAKADINAMVTEAIFQSMLTSLFTPARPAGSPNQQVVLAAQQKAAELAARQMVEYQRARDEAFQAEHRKTIQALIWALSSNG